MSYTSSGSRYYSLVIIYELKSALPDILLVQSSIRIKMPTTSLLPLSIHSNNNPRSTLRIYCPLFAAASMFLLKLVTNYALWRHIPLSSKMSHAYLLACGGTFLTALVIQCFAVLYQNLSFHLATPELLFQDHGALKITIQSPPPQPVEDQGRTTY